LLGPFIMSSLALTVKCFLRRITSSPCNTVDVNSAQVWEMKQSISSFKWGLSNENCCLSPHYPCNPSAVYLHSPD
jgi:hypothetical protein